jgi:light-regulated signal transduction histidine kinase (bacteriophytochrome)
MASVFIANCLNEGVQSKLPNAQLFQNLILNAIKYRSDARPKVHVSAKRRGDVWRLSVAGPSSPL